jgi:hypothetical protein
LAIWIFCERFGDRFGYGFGAMWDKIKIIYSKLPIFLITETIKPFGIVHDIKYHKRKYSN